MEALLHQVFAGLASGAVYASLALALVMIYRVTHFVNFAQGELALCSTYSAWAMIDAGVAYWLAFVTTLVVSFAIGVLVERVVIRPAMRAPALSVVIVFIGLMVILNSVAGWIFGYTTRAFPSPFPDEPLFGNHYLGSHEIGVIGVTLGDARRSSTRSSDSRRSASPCARWPTIRSRAAWSEFASSGCSRSAGASRPRSAPSPA